MRGDFFVKNLKWEIKQYEVTTFSTTAGFTAWF
jgi:hypothetical protein